MTETTKPDTAGIRHRPDGSTGLIDDGRRGMIRLDVEHGLVFVDPETVAKNGRVSAPWTTSFCMLSAATARMPHDGPLISLRAIADAIERDRATGGTRTEWPLSDFEAAP